MHQILRVAKGRLAVLTALTAAAAVAVPAASAIGAASPQSRQDTAAATATTSSCTGFSATNSAVQTRVVTTSTPTFYTSTSWTNLACGSTTVTVPRGRSALVVVSVDGEVTCTGAGGQWCLGRVLIAGAEGYPTAPEPDSFSWANSEPNANQWESNAFTRTRALSCPSSSTAASCTFAIVTQVRNHAANLNFRVDDSTVRAQVTYY
jgi:hypothetical protein